MLKYRLACYRQGHTQPVSHRRPGTQGQLARLYEVRGRRKIPLRLQGWLHFLYRIINQIMLFVIHSIKNQICYEHLHCFYNLASFVKRSHF